MSVIKAKIHWLKAIEPDTKFEPVWTVCLELTPSQIKKINIEAKAVFSKAKEIKVRDIENSINKMWQIRKPVMMASGDQANPPKVVDRHNKAIGPEIIKTIGNETLANVMYSVFEYNNKFGNNVSYRFEGLQVVSLVKYEVEEFDDLGGEDGEESHKEEEFKPTDSKGDDY